MFEIRQVGLPLFNNNFGNSDAIIAAIEWVDIAISLYDNAK